MAKAPLRRKPSKAELAKAAARQQAALAWPSFPEPAPLSEDECDALLAAVPETGRHAERVVAAWTFHTSAHGEVVHGCFSRNYHSTRSTTETTTQKRGGPWYRLKSDAAKALHWAIARECAARLARVEDLHAHARAGLDDALAS